MGNKNFINSLQSKRNFLSFNKSGQLKKVNFLFAILFQLIFVLCAVDDSSGNIKIEQQDIPKIIVGEKIPDYTFKSVLNSDLKSVSIADYRGKPLILEFWATWCAPCLPAMKKLDSLKQHFKDEIEIITVSPEDTDRLERYIKNTGINLMVVSEVNFDNIVPSKTIPSTVLIDGNGIVKAITNPDQIDNKIIEQLISDQPLALNKKKENDIPEPIIIKKLVDKDKQIVMTTYDKSRGGHSRALYNAEGRKNGYVWQNFALPFIIHGFSGLSFERIFFKDGLKMSDYSRAEPSELFTFRIEVAPGLEDKVNETALEYLNNNFDIYGERKVDSLDCHVLTLSNNMLTESSSEKEEYQFRGDELIAKKIKMERLILYIESMRRIIVADRTGLENFYDFDLKWEFEKSETLDRELAKYGMELKKSPTKLPVEITVIHKR